MTHQRSARPSSGSQNLKALEAAPSGQTYLHQNLSMKRPQRITMLTVMIDIQRVISPLKPVAAA